MKRPVRWSTSDVYYRCDWESYYKLKSLHRWFYQTIYDAARWRRWSKKTKYRSVVEPAVCPFFIVLQKALFGLIMLDAKTLEWIKEHYRLARQPHEVEIEEFSEETLKKINTLYEKISTWFIDHKGEWCPVSARRAAYDMKYNPQKFIPLEEVIATIGSKYDKKGPPEEFVVDEK